MIAAKFENTQWLRIKRDFVVDFHIRTLYLDIIKVLFIHQLMR